MKKKYEKHCIAFNVYATEKKKKQKKYQFMSEKTRKIKLIRKA